MVVRSWITPETVTVRVARNGSRSNVLKGLLSRVRDRQTLSTSTWLTPGKVSVMVG